MAASNDSSDLSSLSSLSPAPSEDELEVPSDVEPQLAKKKGILNYFPKASSLPAKEPSPPPRKRSPSPPHEYVLADNPDIAVCTQLPFPLHLQLRALVALVALMRLRDANRRVSPTS